MRRFPSCLICLVVFGLVTACGPFPRDPEGSLKTLQQRGTLRVGVLYAPPWVSGPASAAPQGVEGQLVDAFAKRLGVSLVTQRGSAQDLFDSLRHHQLDLVIGGLTEDSPWRQEVGFTAPYYSSRIAVAVPPGEPIPDDASGLTVSIAQDSYLYDRLDRRGANVERVADLSSASGAIAAQQWQIRGLGYQPSEIVLHERRHVIAVPRGENALLMELERFLGDFTTRHDMDRLIWKASQQ